MKQNIYENMRFKSQMSTKEGEDSNSYTTAAYITEEKKT